MNVGFGVGVNSLLNAPNGAAIADSADSALPSKPKADASLAAKLLSVMNDPLPLGYTSKEIGLDSRLPVLSVRPLKTAKSFASSLTTELSAVAVGSEESTVESRTLAKWPALMSPESGPVAAGMRMSVFV